MTSTSPAQAQDQLQLFKGGVRGEGLLRDFHRYANVVRYQTYAGLKAEVARTYLGVAWWLLEPTLAAVTMHVVFGLLLSSGAPSSAIARRAAFFPFLLVGTFTWRPTRSSSRRASCSRSICPRRCFRW